MVVPEGVRRRLIEDGRRFLGLDPVPADRTIAALHSNEADVPGLDAREMAQFKRIRLMGATGSVLMAITALGVAAQPVLGNPVSGLRVLGVFARWQTSSLALSMLGNALVVLSWLLLGRFCVGGLGGTPTHRISRSQLDRTLLLWIVPLSLTPPMYSTDVYSYLAQSQIAAKGLNPYVVGPATGLGVDNILTRNVPNIWRETPAPYGPFFVWIGRGIAHIVGNNVIAGVLCHRTLALVGIALVVWALPRLSRRCGVAPVSALWLGAANPLVLFHLVAGVHNEALMLGLMLGGLEFCLRAIEDDPDGDGVFGRKSWALLIFGAMVITLSSQVKFPAIIALGFVGMALARQWGRRQIRPLVWSALVMGVVAGVVMLAVAEFSGLGFGWTGTLYQAGAVRSWMSLPTLVGIITGFGGVLLGLGDHTTALLSITRPIAEAIAAVLAVRMLLSTWAGRLHPVGALGVALAAIVLLFPVVQPWYLLWAIVPLAAWATEPAFRVPAVVFSAVVSVVEMPRGADYAAFQIIESAIAGLLVVAVFMFITRRQLPWRRRPGVSVASHRTAPYGVTS
ncbi:hypothetical protein EBN03_21830 [Nocardia stercoris]|uniref:Polyprenol phosphomannose-dependent alpha 1,6 mannosyltransferase MptB n=1 Tax=Nocardia stercoris TaxID=2483361 RepID=A0A3M2L1P3_9NOCA|nr:hypothetical protein EBN03_21830 [Nocardia stercoris]